MGFTGLYWVLLGFTGFYWVLLGFAGFYLVFFVGSHGERDSTESSPDIGVVFLGLF